jgi:hypothetical protein
MCGEHALELMKSLLFIDSSAALQHRRGSLCVRLADGSESLRTPRSHGFKAIILADRVLRFGAGVSSYDAGLVEGTRPIDREWGQQLTLAEFGVAHPARAYRHLAMLR